MEKQNFDKGRKIADLGKGYSEVNGHKKLILRSH